MSKDLVNKVLTILCVPVSLGILLLPFSFLTGWNLATAVIYWFFICPFMAEYLPGVFSGNKDQLSKSLIGLLIFYSFMVLMIFEHYQSDMFLLMMLSFLINMGSITLISKLKKVYRDSQHDEHSPRII